MPSEDFLMSLQDKLDASKADFQAGKTPYSTSPSIIETMRRITAEWIDSGAARKTLEAGDKARAFTLDAPDGMPASFAERLRQGPLVVTFYRGGWCPYCSLGLQALQATSPQIHQTGGRVLAISPQTAANSRTSIRQNVSTFPILSDSHNDVAAAFGLRFALPDDLIEPRKTLKNHLPAFNGDASWTSPMPARYLIAPDGAIVDTEVNPDSPRRPDPSEMLPALRRAAA
jgi:peroxiredoxin